MQLQFRVDSVAWLIEQARERPLFELLPSAIDLNGGPDVLVDQVPRTPRFGHSLGRWEWLFDVRLLD